MNCHDCDHERFKHSKTDGECLVIECTCEGWTEPHGSWPLIDTTTGEDETYCVNCSRYLRHGAPYAERPTGFDEDGDVWVEIWCLYCDLDKETDISIPEAEAA